MKKNNLPEPITIGNCNFQVMNKILISDLHLLNFDHKKNSVGGGCGLNEERIRLIESKMISIREDFIYTQKQISWYIEQVCKEFEGNELIYALYKIVPILKKNEPY